MLDLIGTIYRKKYLLKYLVLSDLIAIQREKLLGIFWVFIEPLIMMIVYIFLVVMIFQRGEPRFPVLLLSALLAWGWFTRTINASVNILTANSRLIKSIYFPRIILPLSLIIRETIYYLFGLIILIPFLFLFEAEITSNVLWFPMIFLIQVILTTGISLIISCLSVHFSDIRNILQFFLRILFYLSPILYGASERVPEGLMGLYMLNPFAFLFISYKNCLVRGISPPLENLLFVGLFSLFVVIAGFKVFKLYEPIIPKRL